MRSPLVVLSLLIPVLLAAGVETSGLTTPRGPERFVVDTGHSLALFKIRHLGVANFYGTFDTITGEVLFAEGHPADCSVEVEIDVASLDANSADREQHLASEDFFDAANHPKWTFESTKVEKGKSGLMKLTGDLTLRGVTKEVEAELEFLAEGRTMMGDHRAGWEARFTIDRTDFGISGVPGGLGKEVEVIVALEGIRQAAPK